MKSILNYIYKKYNNIKFSLLKNLNIRKAKIQVIWNKTNTPNKKIYLLELIPTNSPEDIIKSYRRKK